MQASDRKGEIEIEVTICREAGFVLNGEGGVAFVVVSLQVYPTRMSNSGRIYVKFIGGM